MPRDAMHDDIGDEEPLPPYSVQHTMQQIEVDEDAEIDGRFSISIDSKAAARLSTLLSRSDTRQVIESPKLSTAAWQVPLNIVIQVVGSRGDVQPFIALGSELQKSLHRVRIATHAVFRQPVEDAGLEFFSIGGDPQELMAYMVKNPSLIPGIDSLRNGDIRRKRQMISEMMTGCWRSCTEADEIDHKPFIADAIIANPPSFAHVHCAQALGVPLHIMFTMPWTSTQAYAHPLANLNYSGIDREVANYLSYGIVDIMTWQGLGDVINRFRKTLDLDDVPLTEGPGLTETLRIPTAYCWYPALIPKPQDWQDHINLCGFFFRDTPVYNPPARLVEFLKLGDRPIYVGFGSIVMEDPATMLIILISAIKTCGVRAIISPGWSKFDTSAEYENILFIDDCPHEWLFQHVSVVVHHGGAGTTACGLRNGCPTVIVPFFGDQPFWGRMVAEAGAGPPPIPWRRLDIHSLREAIRFCLKLETKEAAEKLAAKMRSEAGVQTAVRAFHSHLPLETIPCSILPKQAAAWTYKGKTRLSKLAADILLSDHVIQERHLELLQTKPIHIANRRWDPLTACLSSFFGVYADMGEQAVGLVKGPYDVFDKAKRTGTDTGKPEHAGKTTLRAAGATLRSAGLFNVALFKGTMVDMPFAITQGLRAVPQLYGEQVQDHGHIDGIVSGGTVAGKSFVHGVASGLTDLYELPAKGVQQEGALGLVKGVGKGSLGFVSKTSSALLGLVAYPAEGISQSIRAGFHQQTKKRIREGKLQEGRYLLGNMTDSNLRDIVVSQFLDIHPRKLK